MTKFHLKYVDNNTVLPAKENLSAVFLIAIKGTKILAIENDRGWEIPGGHIEEGETHEQALVRELHEEAGATVSNPRLIAVVESDNQDRYKDKVMLMYATDVFELGEFTPSSDAFSRELIEIDEFFKRYKGSFDCPSVVAYVKNLLDPY